MKILKPAHISILTLAIFVSAMLIGMQTDWWQLEGRKTPLDGDIVSHEDDQVDDVDYIQDEHDDDEEHESTEVAGGTTVQNALDLGITIDELEEILIGEVSDMNALIKDIVTERGLKFGEIKDRLNQIIDN